MKGTGGTCNVPENSAGRNSYFRRLFQPYLSGVASGSSTPCLAKNFHQQNPRADDRCHKRENESRGGFLKKLDNHKAACACTSRIATFAGIHKRLRVTPAMESGIIDHGWSLQELLA
jgi:hypothetical protein